MRQPAAADEAVQVVLRPHAAVETGEIEAGLGWWRGGLRPKRRPAAERWELEWRMLPVRLP